MKRHLSTEEISTYIDREVGLAEAREFEAHLAACGECRARHDSLRRVVAGLGLVERATPPPMLAQRIRRQAEEEVGRRKLRNLREAVLSLPVQSGLRSLLAMSLALFVSALLVTHGVEREQRENLLRTGGVVGVVEPMPSEIVTVESWMADAPAALPQTTSEVAGREFVWTERGWVQKGLEGEEPEARMDAGSPEGRRLLDRYSDLQYLLSDGSRVVLRYHLETVELLGAPQSGRTIGLDVEVLDSRGRGIVAA
jgi:hypothetical protein